MKFDYVIVGAGIIGLSLARELKSRHPNATVAIVEKERDIGLHASGRNSGILHAGIYYPSGSLKASLCLAGARAMGAYCDEHDLPIHRVGKVIVPANTAEDAVLDTLFERATNNGAKVELLDEGSLRGMEPDITPEATRAIFSPETAVVAPKRILSQLHTDLLKQKVLFYFENPVTHFMPKERLIRVGNLNLHYGHLFNTAGLYADKVARACGLTDRFTMIPFKGMYFELRPMADVTINHHIYPVPDMNVPFLGVHFTKSVAGKCFIGPTAVPVFGREHYRGIKGVNCFEAMDTFYRLGRQYLVNKQGFRTYAHQEIPRFLKSQFLKSAQQLVPKLQGKDIKRSHKVGIRAQLFDTKNNALCMDFMVRHTPHETHILNAVSPAFTSSFSFAKYVLDSERFV